MSRLLHLVGRGQAAFVVHQSDDPDSVFAKCHLGDRQLVPQQRSAAPDRHHSGMDST